MTLVATLPALFAAMMTSLPTLHAPVMATMVAIGPPLPAIMTTLGPAALITMPVAVMPTPVATATMMTTPRVPVSTVIVVSVSDLLNRGLLIAYLRGVYTGRRQIDIDPCLRASRHHQ